MEIELHNSMKQAGFISVSKDEELAAQSSFLSCKDDGVWIPKPDLIHKTSLGLSFLDSKIRGQGGSEVPFGS